MKKQMVCLVLAAVLVCIIAVIAVNTTGLKVIRETLRTEAAVYAQMEAL